MSVVLNASLQGTALVKTARVDAATYASFEESEASGANAELPKVTRHPLRAPSG
ncbi:hypothetical protein ABZ912_32350 [Nonomuraea angiospora]|uniref:hypothetical protein n=1 Tax=Nonomuraea angiospora TaxID=46172 RepID=UPI0033C1A0BA